eukprot:m.160581 g.160581  ORF g.160581 m.160581 type:complete len:105 (-) comp31187_c0_seq1:1156-1470(-)
MYACVRKCVRVCVCMCLHGRDTKHWIKKTEREGGREREGEKEREREREWERLRDALYYSSIGTGNGAGLSIFVLHFKTPSGLFFAIASTGCARSSSKRNSDAVG